MGREIVRQESHKDPGKRSSLWHVEDALEVLRDGMGTEAIKGIQVNAKPFEKMDKLFYHESVLEGAEAVEGRLLNSNDTKDVQASGCLKELNMANCSLSYLPDEIGNLISLQTLYLQQNNLITLPDCICNLTCLKRLDLECNVSHLPSEIGRLTSLEYLKLGSLALMKLGG
ncbi:hypothetical protein Vadar_014018 [Vaccinium darrowii]|uniref:Uncharacterized protein n=1 Tax=Vaccinium darrowii TaxID=229202 RepID=A0ACB7YMP3_9ERIC|nr:hypothetical protein Vadar_014018 [Vaccinium darrowii]